MLMLYEMVKCSVTADLSLISLFPFIFFFLFLLVCANVLPGYLQFKGETIVLFRHYFPTNLSPFLFLMPFSHLKVVLLFSTQFLALH